MRIKTAANRVVIDRNRIINNAVVERNLHGVVVSVFPLSVCRFEPASTAFYNGVITPEIERDAVEGDYLPDLVARPLECGYGGRLLLWQGLSVEEMVVEKRTVCTVL